MNPIQNINKLLETAHLFYAHPEDIRYAMKWFISQLPGHNSIFDEHPWINYKAINWLEEYLTPTMKIFEYGSGGSTLFFAKRVENVISIEHDKEFYSFLYDRIKMHGIKNCSYILREPKPLDPGHIPDYSLASFSSGWPSHIQYSFEDYVKVIDTYPDGTFDLVVVDGRARPSCALRALPKVKRGGFIMVDNMDRRRYSAISSLLTDLDRRDFIGIVPSQTRSLQTSVWRVR